jgi:hypothetical protein
MIRAADVSAGRQEVVTPAPIMTMLVIARVWLLYDDAEVAENQFPGPFSSRSANGRIRPGYAADFVVFDPDQIEDNATYAAPLNPPSGIAFVFVNGVIALDHGKTTDKNAGRPITRMN